MKFARGLLVADCGGTKCDLVLIDEETGHLVSTGHANGAEMPEVQFSIGAGRSPEVVTLAFSRMLEKAKDNLPEHWIINRWATEAQEKSIWNKFNLSFESIFLREAEAGLGLVESLRGIIIIAGTGSCTRLAPGDGNYITYDGLGPLLGDQGSGYFIGQQLLRHLTLQEQLYPENSPHWQRIMPYLQMPQDSTLFDVIRLSCNNPDRSRIASLAKLAEELALEGYAPALHIMQEAANALCEAVETVVRRANWDNQMEFPIVGAGSVLTKGKFVWPWLKEALSQRYPNAKIICPTWSQAAGLVMAYLLKHNKKQALQRFKEEWQMHLEKSEN